MCKVLCVERTSICVSLFLACVCLCEQILAPSVCLWSGAAVSLCLQEIQSNISQLKELQKSAVTQVSITNTYPITYQTELLKKAQHVVFTLSVHK